MTEHKLKKTKKLSHCPICLHIQGWISDEFFEALKVANRTYRTLYGEIKECPCCDCVVRETLKKG